MDKPNELEVGKNITDSYEDMDGDELNFIEEYDDVDLKTQKLGIILQCTNEGKAESNFDDAQQKKRRIEDLIKDKFSVSDDTSFYTSLDENIMQASDYVLSVLEKHGDIKKRSRKRKATSPAKALTCVKQAIRPKTVKSPQSQAFKINEIVTKNSEVRQKLDSFSLKVNSNKIRDIIKPLVPISIAPYRPFTTQTVTNGASVLKPVIQYRLPVGQTLVLKHYPSSSMSNENSKMKLLKPSSNVTSQSFLLPRVYNKNNDLTSQSSMMVYLQDKKYQDISVNKPPSLRIVNGQPEYLAVIKKSDNEIACKPNLNIENQFKQAKSKILVTMDTNKSKNSSFVNKSSILNSISSNYFVTPKENNCEAFNKLFSNIKLDVTLPDIPDDLFLNNLKFFKCKACEVKFIFEEDIKFHLQRISVVLKFKCICGDQRSPFLTFYNPCTFKIFYKTHISTTSGLKHSTFKNVLVTPIDISSQLSEFKSLESFKELQSLKQQTKMLLEQKDLVNISDDEGSSDEISLYKKSVDNNKVSYNVYDDVPCSVCSSKYNIFNGSYEKHFHNNEFNSSFQCKMCFRYLASKCSYMAHINIHNLSKPYICPECGLHFNKSRPAFMNHVKNTCFHYARYTTVKCKLCPEVVNFANYIKQHIIEKHSNNYFKCNSCNKAFILATGFVKHNTKEHDNLAKSEEVSACPFCKIVISKQLIASHITSKHEADELHGERNNYRCCICEMNFVNNHVMLEHIYSKHLNIFPKELICLICSKPLMTIHSLLKHYASEHKIISEICDGSILIPLKKDSSIKRKSEKQTLLNPELIKTNEDSAKNIKPNLNLECSVELTNCSLSDSKILSCTQCQNTFFNQETYERHIKRHNFLQNKIKTNKKFYKQDRSIQNLKPKEKILSHANCHLCAMIFKNQDLLKIHMLHEHQEKSSNRNYNCSICKTDVKSFASLATLARHLKTSHRLTKEKIETMKVQLLNENLPTNYQQIIDIKNGVKSLKLFNTTGDYVCFWCFFQTPLRDAFLHHIKIHSTNPLHYQCTECGSTYPLLSSLHRHLFAIHAVIDLKAYETEFNSTMLDEDEIEETDEESASNKSLIEPKISTQCGEKSSMIVGQKVQNCVEKKLVKKLDEDKPMEFECNVCYKGFDDRNSLRMHMRVHGMAFIEGTKRTMMASSLNVVN